MDATARGYELVDRPRECDVAKPDTEQSGHLPRSEAESLNPAKSTGQSPRRLGRGRLFAFSMQILLTIFPVLFIALAATASSLNKKPTSQTGRAVQNAISLSPTVFPIIFAAIVGKFFRALGLFGAERGIKLGTLERLIGSQSLFTAIERQIVLRGQYLLGFSMILVWALSPLGGQSALRLLQVTPKTVSTDVSVRYLPIAASSMSSMEGAVSAIMAWPSYAAIYMTSITTSQKQQNSTQDLYGNVKIPALDALTFNNAPKNGSWTEVDHNQEIPYSSMLGVPIAGIPAKGNISFNIISRYYAINCHDSMDFPNSTIFKNTSDGVGAGYTVYSQGATFVVQDGGLPKPSRANDTVLSFNMTSLNKEGHNDDVSFLNCSLAPRDVESSVDCIDQSCQVSSMRNLAVNLTSWWDNYYLKISHSFYWFPLATIGAQSHATKAGSSLTEMWLENPDYSYVATGYNKFANLSRVPVSTLSRNFEILYNTYWQSTFGAEYLFGNLSTDMSLYDNITDSMYEPLISFNTSHGTFTSLDGEQYGCNMTFAAFLIFVSCLLLIAGTITLVLMRATLAPDVLGYVSSYTRDSPFAPSNHASYLDGLERARAMRDVQVTLGDVNVGCETGHVAFAVTAPVQRLRKDRLYD